MWFDLYFESDKFDLELVGGKWKRIFEVMNVMFINFYL